MLSVRRLIFYNLASAVALVLVCGMTALAQSDMDEVHVVPRVNLTTTGSPAGVFDRYIPTVKKNVDLVMVPVTITDPMNRIVIGLNQSYFELFEGKQRQEIKHFSSEDAPASVGILFDMSGSMKDKMDRAKEAVLEFCKEANPQDEFFLIGFSDSPQLMSGFTSKVDDLQSNLLTTVAKGHTALLDAIYLGINKMREAKHSRKALLIISDGGDNHSRYTTSEVKSLIREADTTIYGIGVYDRSVSTIEEMMGPQLLADIAGITGGNSFTIDNPNNLPDVASWIGKQLRHQYVLAYRPEEKATDGKWRKIKVKVKCPKGFGFLQVHAKMGYYGFAQ